MSVIDLHTHVLPNMDDGSPDTETSLAMLQRQATEGVDLVCATPHYYCRQNDIPTFCSRRDAALERLRAAVPAQLPPVVPAAEVSYFPQMEEQDLMPLCIQGTRTLMLEMPFSDWTDLQTETVVTLVLDCGYQVVLVHPERFCFSGSNRYKLKRLAELPLGWQVNTKSLLCWPTRHLALELLEMAPYPLLGSDCHNITSRPPNLKAGREIIRSKLGMDFLKQMDKNAEAAMDGLLV